MPHKTATFDSQGPAAFPIDLDTAILGAIERLTLETNTRRERIKVHSVVVTHLSQIGGWPGKFAVTLLVELAEPTGSLPFQGMQP